MDAAKQFFARYVALEQRKGFIGVRADADVVVWDPEATRKISVETHHQKDDLVGNILALMAFFRNLLENKVYMKAYAA